MNLRRFTAYSLAANAIAVAFNAYLFMSIEPAVAIFCLHKNNILINSSFHLINSKASRLMEKSIKKMLKCQV